MLKVFSSPLLPYVLEVSLYLFSYLLHTLITLMVLNSFPFIEVIPDLIVSLKFPIFLLTSNLTLLVRSWTCFLILIRLKTILIMNK